MPSFDESLSSDWFSSPLPSNPPTCRTRRPPVFPPIIIEDLTSEYKQSRPMRPLEPDLDRGGSPNASDRPMRREDLDRSVSSNASDRPMRREDLDRSVSYNASDRPMRREDLDRSGSGSRNSPQGDHKSRRMRLEDLDRTESFNLPSPRTPTPNKDRQAGMALEQSSLGATAVPDDQAQGYALQAGHNARGALNRNDLFYNAKNIHMLDLASFYQFLDQRDISLVMFYNSGSKNKAAEQQWYKKQFIEASDITNRPNHAFAAVDCDKDKMLCRRESVQAYPILNLYARQHRIDSVKDKTRISPFKLKTYVEQWPAAGKDCCR